MRKSMFADRNTKTTNPPGFYETVTIRPLAAGEIDDVFYRPYTYFRSIATAIFGGGAQRGRAAYKVRDDVKIVALCVVKVGDIEGKDFSKLLTVRAVKALADEIWEISETGVVTEDEGAPSETRKVLDLK